MLTRLAQGIWPSEAVLPTVVGGTDHSSQWWEEPRVKDRVMIKVQYIGS